MKKLSIGLAVIGLMLATLLIGWYGFRPIMTALLSVGAGGFLLLCAWQVVTMAFLGLCWRAVAPLPSSGPVAPFVWGRVIRDSAGSCLPFSAVGGFLLGVRATVLHGVSWSVATLSLVVDLTAEFLAEILFGIAGFFVLLHRSADLSPTSPIVIGLAVALAASVLVLGFQKRAAGLFLKFGRTILHGRFAAPVGDAPVGEDGAEGGEGAGSWDRLDTELAAMYSQPGRVLSCAGGHLVGWVFKGLGNWLAFHLLGANIDIPTGLAIEGLLHVLLIPAIVVPGYAGVQEASYVGIGVLFGVPPEISLGVSLLRRARDLAIGVPVLLIWQLVEVRRLRKPLGS